MDVLILLKTENKILNSKKSTNLGMDGVGGQQHRGLRWTVNLLLEDFLLHLRSYQI